MPNIFISSRIKSGELASEHPFQVFAQPRSCLTPAWLDLWNLSRQKIQCTSYKRFREPVVHYSCYNFFLNGEYGFAQARAVFTIGPALNLPKNDERSPEGTF